MKKRLISLLLVLLMVAAVLPAAVLAEDKYEDTQTGDTYITNNTGSEVKCYTNKDDVDSEAEANAKLTSGAMAKKVGTDGDCYKISFSGGTYFTKKVSGLEESTVKLKVKGGKFSYDGNSHSISATQEGPLTLKLYYSVDGGSKTDTVPSVKEVGDTKKVTVIGEYDDKEVIKVENITLTIDGEIKLVQKSSTEVEYDEKDHAIEAKVENGEGYTIVYSKDSFASFQTSPFKYKEKGDYTVSAKAMKSGEADLGPVTLTLKIKDKAASTDPALVIKDYSGVYDESAHTITVTQKNMTGYTLQYSKDNGQSWTSTLPTLTKVGTITILVKATKSGEEDVTGTGTVTITQKQDLVKIVNCKSSVNVRKSASSSSDKIGTASKGKTFPYLGKSGDWYKIQYTSSKEGFVYKDYVEFGSSSTSYPTMEPEETEAKAGQEVTIINCKNNVNVRKSASSSSTLIGTAAKGAKYPLLATATVDGKKWYKIQYKTSTVGYIFEDYISVSGGESDPTEKPTGNTVTIVNCNSSVNVRKSASSSSEKIGTAKLGTVYALLAQSGSWYQIQYTATKTGWVYKTYCDVDKSGETESPTATTTSTTTTYSKVKVIGVKNSVNVRAGASTDTTKIGTAPLNNVYTYLGQSGSWTKIQYKSDTVGYIYSSYVQFVSDGGENNNNNNNNETATTGYGYVVNCNKSVNVRKSASSSSDILGTAAKNNVYKILGTSGNWFKIQYKSSQQGYIHKDYFTKLTSDTSKKVKITADNVNVRDSASTGATILGTAAKDTTYTYLKTEGSYIWLIYNNRVGMIYTSHGTVQ